MRCDWNEDLAPVRRSCRADRCPWPANGASLASFEPSLRTSASFCTTLRDAIDVAEKTGLKIVSDFGNNWMERDLASTLRRAMPHIALIQIGDIAISGRGGRSHIGKGDLPLKRMLNDVLKAGYDGVFDLEVVPADYSADTDEGELREGINRCIRPTLRPGHLTPENDRRAAALNERPALGEIMALSRPRRAHAHAERACNKR